MSTSGPSVVGSTPSSTEGKNPVVPPSRRRDKPQLSCNLCRRRKLKCDRGQPCNTCEQRGLSLSCAYATANVDRVQARLMTHASAQDRIGQLESLVHSLMGRVNTQDSTREQNPDTRLSSGFVGHDVTKKAEDPTQLAADLGRISLTDGGTSYVEGSHWTAILDGIAELKDSFDDGSASASSLGSATGNTNLPVSNLLCGSHVYLDKRSILAALPARSVADRFVAKFFRTMDMASVLIHTSTFLKQYEQFWTEPSEVSPMWLGMLFAMICLGLQHQQLSPLPSTSPLPSSAAETQRAIALYREKTIQCLMIGNYLKCVPHTIETLVLYMNIEYFTSEDTQVEVWALFGLVVRLSLRMGYHRDPSRFPRITPFQSEMRRRVWATVMELDVIASTHFGLPRIIKESQSDTKEPCNLLEEDLSEDMMECPLERPFTEETPIRYFILKNRLFQLYAEILDSLLSTEPMPYAGVMSLDRKLNDVYGAIPANLKMRPMMQSIMDTSEIIVERLFMAVLFHRGRCTLHRKYMTLARADDRYTYSRSICIQASLQILQFQETVDQETRVGGRFHDLAWKISLAIKQDFLLATTVLCLELSNDLNAARGPPFSTIASEPQQRREIIRALEGSYQIWQQSVELSEETRRATETLKMLLENARKLETQLDAVNNTSITTRQTNPGKSSSDSDAWHTVTQEYDFGGDGMLLYHSLPEFEFDPLLQMDIGDFGLPTANGLGSDGWTQVPDSQSLDAFFDKAYSPEGFHNGSTFQ